MASLSVSVRKRQALNSLAMDTSGRCKAGEGSMPGEAVTYARGRETVKTMRCEVGIVFSRNSRRISINISASV